VGYKVSEFRGERWVGSSVRKRAVCVGVLVMGCLDFQFE
jgi:hypothetical protein